MRLDVNAIIKKKQKKEKITVLTAYDFSFSGILDPAGIDMILVGDSLANVVLGMESTTEITLDEMINHSRAVVRGSKRAHVIGDMPYCSYQKDPALAVVSAKRFIEEAGCQSVKLEWFDRALEVTTSIIQSGVPVMGHIGFTPQTADKLGGTVQGKDIDSAITLIDQARALEKAGCYAIVLECVPWQIAKVITDTVSIPTIGIGAGVGCDGQVLVLNDMLGLFKRFTPKFVKIYGDIFKASVEAVEKYISEVKTGAFPGEKESFTMSDGEFIKLEKFLKQ